MSAWDAQTRRADVVVLTALRMELDAVLKVDDGAVPGSNWEVVRGPSGSSVAFRAFVVESGRPLRVAVAVSRDMGATAAVSTLLPLVESLEPRCIAMCGICAGRRGKVRLGDVVAAERLYYHDTGKQLPARVRQDLTTYKLRDDWKAALESLDVVTQFRDAAWFQARPLTTEWREHRALVALRDGVPEPWKAVDPMLAVQEWSQIVAALRERRLLADSGRDLTEAGRRVADQILFEHMGKWPDLSPAGNVEPFRLHVAPMGSGARIIEDEAVWAFISPAIRKTLALDMESAALGEVAHRQRQHELNAVVMKGVMDFADHGRDDHFKEFAARASAECLLWFLRQHVPTEAPAGFDDLLTPGVLPPPGRAPAPSFLLNARHAIVPWRDSGRSEILADLDTWADDSLREVAVRLLHAEGGSGKTRLAIEWVRRRRKRYDVAGFLVPNPDSRWLERLCGLGPPVLMVVDYAESRSDLVGLLEEVAAFAAGAGLRRRVRLLLLARDDGDWWATLPRQSSAIGSLLEDAEVIELFPLAVTAAEREDVFAEASETFAVMLGRPPVPRRPIPLDDARFERVLYLHMAALAAVEDAELEASSLLDVILDHEERFWTTGAADWYRIAIDVPLARQLVAAATLRGGLTREAAHEMWRRFTGREPDRDGDALIGLLHDVYAHVESTKYIPGLEPDLLGEGIVLRVAAPPVGADASVGDAWIERVFAPEDDAQALTTAFAVLGRASTANPGAVRPWITNLLKSELPRRALLALRAAEAVGQRTAVSPLGDLLADELEQHGSISIALNLQIPRPTVSLLRVAEWQSRILLWHTPEGDDPSAMATRAGRLVQHGADLSALGRREAALAATREAVKLYRSLAMQNPDAFLPYLAATLNKLGNTLADSGTHEPALAATRESVEIYRALATRNPDASLPYLAASLNNLAYMLRIMGQLKPALAAAHEAVGLNRSLVKRDPAAWQPDLAMSLNNLGNILSAIGQHEPALRVTSEAVDLLRALATRSPDMFLPGLASSLNNLGAMPSIGGQRESALTAIREAVDVYRSLAAHNPDAFLPDLATSLNNLGNRLSAMGWREAALASTREAVNLRRALAARDPDAFQSDLAKSLSSLGAILSALGQREPALETFREAVALRRTLAERDSDAFQFDLAKSLNHLGATLSDLGRYEQALEVTREAVEIYRLLATRDSTLVQPDLAMSLTNLGAMCSELGRNELALEATREAVDLYRALATHDPEAFRPYLAGNLNNLSAVLGALGRHSQAFEATHQAVNLYRLLATRNPDVFQPEFALSLHNMGAMLSYLDNHEQALATTRESVELYRLLASRDPEAFRLGLSKSLHNLVISLMALDQHEQALEAEREAVEILRPLVTQSPDAFQPDLAKCLGTLGIMLAALGQEDAALGTIQEALDLVWPFFERSSHAHAGLTGVLLRSARTLHEALGIAPSSVFVERERHFSQASSFET
jgi:tetratricopeptide (TPR) repeat protein/nucleoside phosphorylase